MRVVLAFLVCWCAAPAVAQGGPTLRQRMVDVDAFTFTVEPARIVVGETSQAVLTITASDDDGSPLDVAPPLLVASTGTIGAPERQGPGAWIARFVPPKEAFPHVAVVSATIENAEETVVGFVAVPLWGKGQTTVNTKPGSEVTVVVGTESFGPVAADAQGDARVPIVVPPGPEHAVAKSIDAVGNESQKSVDLGVPPFNRLAALALDDVVVGDGTGSARVLAFAVDKKGAPLIEAPLVARATVGEVAAPIALAPGVFLLLWKPGAARAQDAALDLSLDGAPLSSVKVALRVIGGAPAQAAIGIPRRSVSADENPELVVRLSVSDSGNNPLSFGVARVDVDYGRLEAATGTDVVRQVTWVLPRERNRQTARLFVRAVDGTVLGKADITLTPGAPAKLTLQRLAPIVADGSTGAAIVVTAADAWGNPVVPKGAEIAVEGGRIVAKNLDVAGKQLRALFVPSPREDEGLVDVSATLGALEVTAPLRLRPKPRALLLVGPAVGSSYSYGDVLGIGPELSMLVRLPVLNGAVHTGLTLAVHQGIRDASALPFAGYRTYPILGELAWRPLVLPAVGFHLGVAGGVVVIDAVDPANARAIEAALGGAVVAGVAFKVGPGYVELDGRVGGAANLASPPLIAAMPFGAGVVLGYRFGI